VIPSEPELLEVSAAIGTVTGDPSLATVADVASVLRRRNWSDRRKTVSQSAELVLLGWENLSVSIRPLPGRTVVSFGVGGSEYREDRTPEDYEAERQQFADLADELVGTLESVLGATPEPTGEGQRRWIIDGRATVLVGLDTVDREWPYFVRCDVEVTPAGA
jgi:hypothetical protein